VSLFDRVRDVATIAADLISERAEVAKGRRRKVEDPRATPPSEAMDPWLAQQRTSPSQDANVGTVGVAATGGYVNEIERNPSLVGVQRYVTYNNNIRSCYSAALGVRALLMLIGGVHWDVDPPISAAPPEPTPGEDPAEDDDPAAPGAPAKPSSEAPTARLRKPGAPAKPASSPEAIEKLAPGATPQHGEADGETQESIENEEDPALHEPEVDPEAEEAKRLAEWLETVLFKDMHSPWTRVIRRLGMFKFHGFSIHEWTAIRRDDGTIGIASVDNRAQVTIEQWDLDRTGAVQGVMQRIPQDGSEVYIPRWKMVYVVDDELADGDPRGVGMLRHSVDTVREAKRLEQLEGIGFESDLRGVPFVRAPIALMDDLIAAKKWKPEDKTKALEHVVAFMNGHVRNTNLALMVDSSPHRDNGANQTPSATPQWDASLLRGEGQSHEQVRIAIDAKHREIARTMFSEGFMLGGDGGSNRALGEEKSRFLADFANSVLTDIADALNMDLVRPLWAINGYDEKYRPTLRFEAVSIEDVTRVAEMLSHMAKAGATLHPKDPVINTVRVRARLPKVPDKLVNEQDQQAKDMMATEQEAMMVEAEATAAGAEATRAGIGHEEARIAQGDKKMQLDAKLKTQALRAKPKAKPAGKRPAPKR